MIPRPFPGLFCVIEGADHAGKSSQMKRLAEYLYTHPEDNNRFFTVILTREPHNTIYGKRIREILLEKFAIHDRAMELAELYVKDRWIHINELFLPALKRGDIVLSDRFKYSTIAYQGAQGATFETVVKMHEEMPSPDIVFYIKVSVEERMRRKAADRDRPYQDIFDSNHKFQEKLDVYYEKTFAQYPKENIVVINGNQSPDDVFADIKVAFDAYLQQHLQKNLQKIYMTPQSS